MAQIVPGLSDFVDHDDCTQTIADNATDAEARLVKLELPVIAGTDAAVTMLVNRHYELDGSILTADRNYTLPTPTTTGDRIRVSLTSGNASYECIIKGNTGITVNGGSAGAEWSRLCIARECAEFRATDATNWDVWDDGRIALDGLTTPSTAATISNATWSTSVNFGTVERNVGAITSSGKFTARRAGVATIGLGGWLSAASGSASSLAVADYYFQMVVTKNGTVFSGTGCGVNARDIGAGGPTGLIYPTVFAVRDVAVAVGDVFELNVYQETGGTAYLIVDASNFFSFAEKL